MDSNEAPWKVVILGGGYAGVMSANRLAGKLKSRVEITMINPIPEFVERIRLHEVAARSDSESATRHELRELLHPSVRLRLGVATRIRPEDRAIDWIESGSRRAWTQSYDELIYTVGSGAGLATVPGVRRHAYDVSNLDGARKLKATLDALPSGRTVLVVGGGATAIELVAEIAVARPQLTLKIVTASAVGPTLSPHAREYIAGARAMRNVEVVEHARITEVLADGVVTADGRTLSGDCVVWAASFAVPGLARESGLEVDGAGRLVVDSTMRSPQHREILGAGDGAVISGPAGRTLRMACATACPQGAHAAASIVAAMEGLTPAPFTLSYLVLSLSLGPGDGLVQRTNSDDSPRDRTLDGRLGAWFKELNSRYARQILRWERRRAGTYRWAKPRSARALPTGDDGLRGEQDFAQWLIKPDEEVRGNAQ